MNRRIHSDPAVRRRAGGFFLHQRPRGRAILAFRRFALVDHAGRTFTWGPGEPENFSTGTLTLTNERGLDLCAAEN